MRSGPHDECGPLFVEMRGFEPRFKGFSVNILRAQLTEDCWERHYC